MKTAFFVATVLFTISNLTAETDPDKLVSVPAAPATAGELVSLLGVEAWSLQVPTPGGKDYQIAVFAKIPGKPPIRLTDGTIIRAKDKLPSHHTIVQVAVEGLHSKPHQKQIKVGIYSGLRGHFISPNPFPPNLATLSEGNNCYMDEKGRIALLQGAREIMTALPYVDGHEFSLYLQLSPWDDSTSKPTPKKELESPAGKRH